MAPRKKAEDKPALKAANDAADTILHYLRKQNRPYSALEVSANLHNKVTKAVAAKILKDLHERNEIEGRSAGKQVVYHALQDPDDSCSPEQLAALDTATTKLRNTTATLQASAKMLRNTLAALNSTLSTTDLVSAVQALEAERSEIVVRLAALKAGKVKMVTKQERDEAEREWKKWSGTAKRREKISREMWKLIEDSLPGKEKKAEIWESLGLED